MSYKLHFDGRNRCLVTCGFLGLDEGVEEEEVEETSIENALWYAMATSKSASGFVPALLLNVAMKGAQHFGTKYRNTIFDPVNNCVKIVTERGFYQVFIDSHTHLFNKIVHQQDLKVRDSLPSLEKFKESHHNKFSQDILNQMEGVAKDETLSGIYIDTVQYLETSIRAGSPDLMI